MLTFDLGRGVIFSTHFLFDVVFIWERERLSAFVFLLLSFLICFNLIISHNGLITVSFFFNIYFYFYDFPFLRWFCLLGFAFIPIYTLIG